ncbi:hypothetical protein [Desulfonatronum thioautotrophicum]|uniref:hypothetical protein n=1 Tax=Desulfonatronum thioautotrophicum TaxID=617001 RepID=UPI0005EBC660|nr:hypothetical protein [Desulfonatronum thioautotrophicum]
MSLETLKAKDLALGQEFLTWIWFRSERSNGQWQTQDGVPFGLTFEGRVMVQSGEGDYLETAVCSGPGAELHEAKSGLLRGKKVHQAKLRMEEDGHGWHVTIKAEDFSTAGFKTPKVEFRLEEGQDPDGPFLEKMYLLERALLFFDQMFLQFLKLRFSPQWADELRAIRRWVDATAGSLP